jgi:TPR repeat protein
MNKSAPLYAFGPGTADSIDLPTFMGMCFDEGLRFAKNREMAISWYKTGVKAGSGLAAFRLAILLEASGQIRHREVEKLYRTAAKTGITAAFVNWGVLIEPLAKTANARKNVLALHQRAHQAGLPLGTYNLGRYLYEYCGELRRGMSYLRKALKSMEEAPDPDYRRPVAFCRRMLKQAPPGQKEKRRGSWTRS